MIKNLTSTSIRRISAEHIIYVCVLLLVLGALVAQCYEFCKTPAFASDDILYTHYFPWREGRWFQVFFTSIVSTFNGKLIAIVNTALLLPFFWCALRNLVDEKWAVVGAIVCVMAPPVHQLNMWPLCAFPSILLLPLAAIARYRMTKAVFFCLFGILFNGCLSHYYFLLPLLFLCENRGELVRTLIWWVIGYVLGFACAELYVLLRTGHLIEFVEWRKPHPIHSVEDAVQNFVRIVNYFTSHLKVFSPWDAVYFSVAVPVMLWHIAKKRILSYTAVVIILLVSLSAYAQSFPAGIIISIRSCLCLFVGIFFFLMWASAKRWICVAFFCFYTASAFHCADMKNIEYHNVIRTIWYKNLKALNYQPELCKGCVLLVDDDSFSQQVERLTRTFDLKPLTTPTLLNNPFNWRAIAMELGFHPVIADKWENCKFSEKGIDISDLQFRESPIYWYAVKDSYLFLKMKK